MTYPPQGAWNVNTATAYPGGASGVALPRQSFVTHPASQLTDRTLAHVPAEVLRSATVPATSQTRYPYTIPPSVLQATPQVAGVSYARTVPISSGVMLPSLPDIPPPHLVAPHLFNQVPRQNIIYPATQNVYSYPYNYGYGYPYTYTPQQYTPPQNNPAANPLDRNPTTPAPVTPLSSPASTTASTTPTKDPVPPANSLASLDNATVTLLNERLNNSNENVRGTAAMDFYKILEVNPDLSRPDSPYKGIVDAFMTKILRDPNPVVRNPALLAFEMGCYYSPTQPIINELQELAGGTGLHHLEPQVVKGILANIQSGKFEPPAASAMAGSGLLGGMPSAAQPPVAFQGTSYRNLSNQATTGTKLNIVSNAS